MAAPQHIFTTAATANVAPAALHAELTQVTGAPAPGAAPPGAIGAPPMPPLAAPSIAACIALAAESPKVCMYKCFSAGVKL